MADDPVTRHEFERVVQEHERRMDGHDNLYSDLRATREELVRFTEALEHARASLATGSTDRKNCRDECAAHRDGFHTRIVVLERFRWQVLGIVALLCGIPAYISLFLIVTSR